MVPRCSVCSHPSRPEIDRGLMQGLPYRSLAGQFGLSPSALCRHTKHLARQLDWQQRQEEQSRQAALLDHLELLDTRLNRLFNSALDLRALHVPWAASGSPSASTPKRISWSASACARRANPDGSVPLRPRPSNEKCCKSRGLPPKPPWS